MAEKEERIFITTIERAEDIDEFCVYGRDCMTHSEAIEKMAKAICLRNACIDSCSECIVGFQCKTQQEKEKYCEQMLNSKNDLRESFYEMAEASLDALFGD